MVGSSFFLLFLSVFYGRETPFLFATLSSGHWLTWTSFQLPAIRTWTLGHYCLLLDTGLRWPMTLGPAQCLEVFFFPVSDSKEILVCFWSYYPVLVFPFCIIFLCVWIRGCASASEHKLPACYWLKCFYFYNIWNYFCVWCKVNINSYFFLYEMKQKYLIYSVINDTSFHPVRFKIP